MFDESVTPHYETAGGFRVRRELPSYWSKVYARHVLKWFDYCLYVNARGYENEAPLAVSVVARSFDGLHNVLFSREVTGDELDMRPMASYKSLVTVTPAESLYKATEVPAIAIESTWQELVGGYSHAMSINGKPSPDARWYRSPESLSQEKIAAVQHVGQVLLGRQSPIDVVR